MWEWNYDSEKKRRNRRVFNSGVSHPHINSCSPSAVVCLSPLLHHTNSHLPFSIVAVSHKDCLCPSVVRFTSSQLWSCMNVTAGKIRNRLGHEEAWRRTRTKTKSDSRKPPETSWGCVLVSVSWFSLRVLDFIALCTWKSWSVEKFPVSLLLCLVFHMGCVSRLMPSVPVVNLLLGLLCLMYCQRFVLV